MANLTLRSTTSATTPSSTTAKSSALTHVEMDSNFILLNDEKLDAANGTATGTLQLANNGILQLNEATSNGTNYVQIKTPAALAGNYVLTLPADDGNANDVLVSDGSGGLSWSATGGDITGVTAGNGLSGGGASGAVTLNIDVSDTAITKDEDDMSSNSNSHLATQQSIKAYVDATVAATNEVVEDTTPQLGGDLDTQAFALTGTDVLPSTGSYGGQATGTGGGIRLHTSGSDHMIRTQQTGGKSNIVLVTDIDGSHSAGNGGSGLIYSPLNIQVRDDGHSSKTRTTFDIGVPYRGDTGTTITQGSVTGKLLDVIVSSRKIYLHKVAGGSFATSTATTGKVTGTVTAVNSIGTNAVELTYDTDFANTAVESDLADVGFARFSARDVLNTPEQGLRGSEPELHFEAGRIAFESNGTKMIDCEDDGSLKVVTRASNKHIVFKPDQTGATGDSGPESGYNGWGGGKFHINGVQSIEAGTDTPSTDLLFNTGLQITGRSDNDSGAPNFPTIAFKHHDGEGSVTSGSDNRDTASQGYGNIWFQRYNKDADDGAIDLVENGQILGGFFGGGSISNLGWYTSGFAQTASATCGMFMRATDDWTTSSVPTRMEFQATPSGSLTKQPILDISGSSVLVNPTNLDVDFQVDGDTNDAILKVDANKEIVSTGGVFQVYAASGDPSSNLVEGQMYFNSSTKKFMGYNGTAWVVIGSQS